MPLPRGSAPTSNTIAASRKAILGSSVTTKSARSGKAQSSSSIATPLRAD